MRIVLISPKGPLYRHRGGIFKKSLRYMPLTLTTLASLVPEELGAEIELIDEGIADVPLDLEADLIGLTVITGTARRTIRWQRPRLGCTPAWSVIVPGRSPFPRRASCASSRSAPAR